MRDLSTETPIREVLSRREHSLRLADDEEFVLDVDDRRERPFLHRVVARSFADLQALDLVPAQLNEDEVRRALRADDEEVLSLARSRLVAGGEHACSCHGPATTVASSYAGQLRAAYNSLRKAHNPHLARVLSDNLGRHFAWDDLEVSHARWWADQLWRAKIVSIIATLFADVTVGRGAILTIGPSVKLFYAGDIRVHSGGKIRCLGSYHKFSCFSFEGNIA